MFAPGGGEPGAGAGEELVDAARRVASDVLAPGAAATDQADIVPDDNLRALAEAGLFGVFAPDPVPTRFSREIFETLAGACGVTFFVWVQHHAPVRLLVGSSNSGLRDRLLPRLSSGEMLGGVAFAHLRRHGPPAIAAHPVDGGYVFTGEAPWVTSWGLAGVYAVAALTEDGRVVFAAVPGDARGLSPSPPLPLAVMNASSTVRLGFDRVEVASEDVIVEEPLATWQERDRTVTAQPNPAAFGVAATCVRLLEGGWAPFASELADCRDQSYGRADSPAPDIDELVALRAWSLELAMRCAYALVVASGGRSMLLSHPAQRLSREASFYAIQAQTGALRGASLDRLIAPPRPDG
ncbi:MAG: acyl-CoA dehydrogenase family protein [Acidimicrobiales bacterium]